MATAARPTARHAKYEREEVGIRLHAVDLTQYAHTNKDHPHMHGDIYS